jgi:hypothetical protein
MKFLGYILAAVICIALIRIDWHNFAVLLLGFLIGLAAMYDWLGGDNK